MYQASKGNAKRKRKGQESKRARKDKDEILVLERLGSGRNLLGPDPDDDGGSGTRLHAVGTVALHVPCVSANLLMRVLELVTCCVLPVLRVESHDEWTVTG